MHTDDGLDLDAELVEVLHWAAAALPGYRGDPAVVAGRRTARRRRHLFVAVVAGLTVTVLAGGVAMLGTGRSAPSSGTAPARQGLFLLGGGGSWDGANGAQVGLRGSAFSEVLPHGELVTREVPGLPVVEDAVSLPDGGFVALGYRTPFEPGSTPAPGASRTSPPAAEKKETVAVVRPDGSVRYLTDTAASWLLGADDRRVYLNGAGVIAMDLATGRQQRMDWPDLRGVAVLAAGRFAELVGGQGGALPQSCTPRLVDARTGTLTSQPSLPAGDCLYDATALSPDGRWLAIVQPGPFMNGNINELHLVLVNLDTGEQTAALLDEGPAVPDSGIVTFQGMAWLDDGRVRIVWTRLPDNVERMYDVSEVLRMRTVEVPG
jgi:hypothetical protein